MKKTILAMLIEDVIFADDVILKVVDGEYVSVESDGLAFSTCEEVDEFAVLIKEMIKGIS